MPFQTAALHSLFCIFGRYSSRILATALLDKYPIRFWTILSISCLFGSYILVYFAGYYATRDNFVYVQVIFGLLNGIGTGTGHFNFFLASHRCIRNRIPTVKLKIPGKAFLKSESRTSVTLFIFFTIFSW